MSKIIRISNGEYTDNVICHILKILKKNKTLIMPSDTIYGFLTRMCLDEKIRNIKHRDDKPFLYLISKIEMLNMLDINPEKYKKILNNYWPGPITFIMKNKSKKTIGVRIPKNDFLIKIINGLGEPLISTSVNLSKESPINNLSEIKKIFGKDVDCIIEDKNFIPSNISTIVDISKEPYKVLREGEIIFENC